MAWLCVAPGFEIDDVKADRKTTKRIEAHWASDEAVYFDGRYLPYGAIKQAHIQPSVYRPAGCCGRGIPVHKLCLDYGADELAILMFEKEENAKAMLNIALGKNPGIEVKRYLDPVTGLPPEQSKTLFA